MNHSLKRTIGIGIATAAAATAMLNTVMPPADSFTDKGHLRELQREYKEVEAAQSRERQRLVGLLADANIADHNRPAEIRAAERQLSEYSVRLDTLKAEEKLAVDGARDAARAIVRRVP